MDDQCPHCGCMEHQDHHTECPNHLPGNVKVVVCVRGWTDVTTAYLHPSLYDLWLDRPALPLLP